MFRLLGGLPQVDGFSSLPTLQSSMLPTWLLFSLAYALLWVAFVAYVAHARTERRWVGRLASATTLVSWGLLTAGLIGRALAAGHWPLANPYEFALCWVWSMAGIYLLFEASWRRRWAGAGVLGMALLVATYALTRPADQRVIAPLLPALRSAWFLVHGLSCLVGYGAFGVAAGLGLVRLIRPSPPGGGAQAAEIERSAERAVALGFPWLTLGILSGAIWAQNAWGRYWGWDAKETWALATWLWYVLILHLRPLPRWRGRWLAGLVVAGFGIVLFTFVGVPWLVRTVRLESLHGF